MFRPYLVLTYEARLLVLLATYRVGRLAAIAWRHLLLHALPELCAFPILARRRGLLATFALLRVARLCAVNRLCLLVQALFALRAKPVLTGIKHFFSSRLTRLALLYVSGIDAIRRATFRSLSLCGRRSGRD